MNRRNNHLFSLHCVVCCVGCVVEVACFGVFLAVVCVNLYKVSDNV